MTFTDGQRVSNSIDLLDTIADDFSWIGRDWRSKININTLEMASVRNCVLGQLWRSKGASGGYDEAFDALHNCGYYVSEDEYEFCSFTDLWKIKIGEGQYVAGETWYRITGTASDTCTILSSVVYSGVRYITYGFGNSVSVYREKTFKEYYTKTKPARFVKGDELIDSKGRTYYYFSDDRVVSVSDSGLSWASLKYYEDAEGVLKKRAVGLNGAFFFDGSFWGKN